jgi:hypothetical protein
VTHPRSACQGPIVLGLALEAGFIIMLRQAETAD